MKASDSGPAHAVESAEIKSVVMAYYDAMRRSDLAFLAQLLSREACLVAIGTQPDEWYSGRDALLQKYGAELESTGGAGFAFTAGDVAAYSEGSVGWAADSPTIKMGDGTIIPLRFTFLFHRDGGQWTFVQGHMSAGIWDDELPGLNSTSDAITH